MNIVIRFFVASLALAGASLMENASAQTPTQPPAPPEGNIYAVTYVEVMPTAKAQAVALLKTYRDTTRKENGNLSSELVQRVGLGHQFVVLEAWKDFKTFEAHGKTGNAILMRDKITEIRNAPIDQRVHTGLSAGSIDAATGRGKFYVVTYVDVIPPRKDDGVAAVKTLGEESRKNDGNLRFEILQQTNRPNHFTVVEVWKDEKSADRHSMAPATRAFRDMLAPMSGALYDERMYRAVN
jgi:quinol monooxygenase YgiN